MGIFLHEFGINLQIVLSVILFENSRTVFLITVYVTDRVLRQFLGRFLKKT